MSGLRSGHRGRVFYSYLLSFFVILIVPVVTSVIVFQRADAIVQRDAREASDVLLAQTRAYLDLVIDDVSQLDYLVSYNNELETLVYDRLPMTGDEYYRAHHLAEAFRDYRDATSGIVDFYVYFPALDLIVSPDGYFTTRNFHTARRSPLEEPYRQWLDGLRLVNRTLFRSRRVALEPRANLPTPVGAVEVVSPLPVGAPTTQPRAWSVIQIRESVFRDRAQETPWAAGSIFLVHHPDHGLISSSNPEVTAQTLRDAGVSPAELRDSGELSILDRRFFVFSRTSELDRWRSTVSYSLLVPRDQFVNQFVSLRRFTVAAFVISILVGIALIYYVALARYKPIQNLLAMVQPDADGTITLRSDEFQILRSSLQATIAEDKLLREELVASRPLVLQRYILQLLKGSVPDTGEVDEKLGVMGFSGRMPWLSLVLIEPYLHDRSVYPRVVAFIEERLLHWHTSDQVLIRDIDGVIAILCTTPSRNQGELRREVQTLKEAVEEEFVISSAVAMSDSHTRREGFPILLREARAALSYRLVKGGTVLIHFSDVLTTGRTYYYPIEEESKLLNSIGTGSYDDAVRILKAVFSANFGTTQLSVEMARCLMFDLISTMIKALNSISSVEGDAEFWSEVRPITRLTSCHSLEELQTVMDEILRSVCDRVRAGRTPHAEHLRNEILEFVEEHLHDRNLGPEMVADHLSRNAAYIGRFFRDEMGIGLSSYIKRQRVADAKHLLATSESSVREIADRVGFGDSNALIRAFKHTEGITPGEFRDSTPNHIASSAPNKTNVQK